MSLQLYVLVLTLRLAVDTFLGKQDQIWGKFCCIPKNMHSLTFMPTVMLQKATINITWRNLSITACLCLRSWCGCCSLRLRKVKKTFSKQSGPKNQKQYFIQRFGSCVSHHQEEMKCYS